ncbi:MAG: hypothetical protein K8T25_18865 [Planctomycetia bacterium]|nr:hypothetical protein [Planctomycetia bacterium]
MMQPLANQAAVGDAMVRDSRQFVRLEQAAPQIRDADLLLWRCRSAWRDGVSAWLIAVAGRGEHYHAAMAGWWGAELMCLESRLTGVQAVTLASQVEQYPGAIDVFALVEPHVEPDSKPSVNRQGAVRAMRGKTGRRYGRWNLLRTAATHMFLARLLVRPDLRDNGRVPGPEFCSEAVSSAMRCGGGLDPVPHLHDRMTEPADLARSACYAYRFTLLP